MTAPAPRTPPSSRTPTDVSNPAYYHKVVDCQWACPAHTNVPEYIRLIAQGRYTESYLLNRESNVFPGILGRTCDRPCEPVPSRRANWLPIARPGQRVEPACVELRPASSCALFFRCARENRAIRTMLFGR